MFGLGGATLVASLWIYNAGTLTLTIFVHTKMDLEVDICTFVGAAAWCGRGVKEKSYKIQEPTISCAFSATNAN